MPSSPLVTFSPSNGAIPVPGLSLSRASSNGSVPAAPGNGSGLKSPLSHSMPVATAVGSHGMDYAHLPGAMHTQNSNGELGGVAQSPLHPSQYGQYGYAGGRTPLRSGDVGMANGSNGFGFDGPPQTPARSGDVVCLPH